MFIKINKKFYVKIYFHQIQCSLLFNGRLLKSNSTKIKIFINFLNCLSVSVNIIENKDKKKRNKRKRRIISNKLLLKISIKINKIIRNNKDYINNEIKINKEINNVQKNNINLKNIFNTKSSIIMIIIFIIFVFVFIYDYKSIEAKINQSNYYEIKKIESDYKINKCKINGELPSLKQKCELMLSQIELLKSKKPSLISVFFIWLMDIFNSYFTTFNLINCIITILFIIIVYKLIK